ncbi:MAG: GGDEF domain-containing protein [Polycyclovorans sp.]|nr:GGDEF domain-containing protein [Polycyclovorans sp.]
MPRPDPLEGPHLLLSETDLRRARRSMWRRLTFNAPLERAYRASQGRRYRTPRTLLFGLAALSFLIAPMLNKALFQADPAAVPMLLFIQLAWALPVLGLGALAPWLALSRSAHNAINMAGCLTLWGSCYAQLYLTQLGWMTFPLHMVNYTVVAVAVFGGFRARLMVVGGSLTMALSLITVIHFDRPDGDPDRLFAYETAYLWLIGIGGAVTTDLLNREGWLYRAQIRLLSRTDALSGLLTRGAFDEHYRRVIAAASREQRHVAVALIDLDHFKTFNDRYGHLKGDEVLTQTGTALLSVEGGRPLDLRARYGGEEFIAVWYDVQPDDLEVMGQRFLNAIRCVDVRVEKHGERIPVTASIGIAAGIPTRLGGDALIEAADRQLYAAKAAGRNCMQAVVLTADGAPLQHNA